MGYMDTVRDAFGVFLHPKSATSRSMSIGDSLKFYYKIMIIPLILGVIVSYLLGSAAGVGLTLAGTIAAYFIILYPLGILVDGGIYHILIGKLFKLYRAGYARVVSAYTYGIIPSIFIAWIAMPLYSAHAAATPTLSATYVAGIVLLTIFGIWSFIIILFALSNQLQISKLKAFGTLILEGVIVSIIVFAVIFAFGAAFLPSLTGA